jgi:[ribosomal protein S18]-alanine N-acetyltransferase
MEELILRQAAPDDLSAIMRIENASFSAPWPEWSLAQELLREDSLYVVAERAGIVVGYAGLWVGLDEAHVGTIAVSPEARGQGVAEAIMLALLECAGANDAGQVILEYRVSNTPAARLYEKLGFRSNRIRRRYYPDNQEDAVEAILDDLPAPLLQSHLAALVRQWEARHGQDFPWPDYGDHET